VTFSSGEPLLLKRPPAISKSCSSHLIILNSLERTVQIAAYDRDSFEQAVTEYGKVEAEAAQGEKIEPVLVSAGPIDKLRRAYPNFFLDIEDFANIVQGIISGVKDENGE
jgi:putative GTP pyrophosphokinase